MNHIRILTLSALGLVSAATAQVPTYTVRPIASFTVTTTVRGVSPGGHVVGDQIVLGVPQPFLATESAGLTVLPLPAGYVSGLAMDANRSGVVVGAVGQTGFPFDSGEPAIWLPLPGGGYQVVVPQQFTVLTSPLGPLAVNGGMAVGVNENGTVVGWSRYQGFQGGPTTLFSVSGAPVDLGALGFSATVRDLSDHTDLIVGDRLRMDLNTGVVTNLGLPTSGGSFTSAISFAVNDSGESVAAVALATSLPDRWLTFRHSPVLGWTRHNPAVLPSRFVGKYDINNRGDVAASGGTYFRTEDVLIGNTNSLLDAASQNWTVDLGFITDDRSIYTTAVDNSTGSFAIVRLEPRVEQTDLGFQGPGSATASLAGTGLGPAQSSDYVVGSAPSSAPGFISVSMPGNPDLPLFGGTLVSFDGTITATVATDPSGALSLRLRGLNVPAFEVILQSAFADPSAPQGVTITNAIQASFGR